MSSKIPRIFVNKIEKIRNNKEVYYSYLDKNDNEEEKLNKMQIHNKINELFKSNDFVYKKKFLIKTKNEEKEHTIIFKSYDYLLTINGKKIYINDILDIN